MIKIAREPLSVIFEEGQELLVDHWREVALYQEDRPLAVDWGTYEHLEETGSLVIYTARNDGDGKLIDDGKLIGYCAFFLRYSPHYRFTLSAANDVVFIDNAYRNAGRDLILHADAELPKLGVQHILWHVKLARDFRPLLHTLGYIDEEVVVGRFIKGSE